MEIADEIAYDVALRPADDDGSSTPPRATLQGYVKCSLCNHIIDDEAIHFAEEHEHLAHIHKMMQAPLPSPSLHADVHALGAFAVSTSQSADRGAAAFRVMQRAQQQLHRLLDGMDGSNGNVYAFGSVVSMGCWDGEGDGDFALVDPKWYYTPAQDGQVVIEGEEEEEGVVDGDSEGEETKSGAGEKDAGGSQEKLPIIDSDDEAAAHDTAAIPNPAQSPALQHEKETDTAASVVEALREVLDSQVISSTKEKRLVRNVTARLRDVGFRFDELDPVLHTRIPVVRRKRPTHVPLNLRAMQQDHLIRVCFDRHGSEERFREGRLETLLSTYHAREVKYGLGRYGQQLVIAVPDSCDAVHLMSRRERIPGVRKMWAHFQRTPEIFAIDFDLSCRFHGIRNSWLLRRYLEQDEVFRLGNVFLKTWTKACGINNSRVGFLTSYATSVLWVYFLLRRGEASFVDPEDIPVLPDPEKQMEIPYMALWPEMADAAANAARTTRLGALLRDFFYFYGEEFDWATHVVTIRRPCPTSADVCTKAELGWLANDTLSLLLRERCYHIFSIEDVYENNLDLGRHLTADKAAWTRLQFRLAYTRCCGTKAQVLRLLDTPQQRASDVLRARLFTHLLLHTDDAAATVEELVSCLCQEDALWAEEDPKYLLGAYELGSRLSDLWYDAETIGLDVANHRRYDRRADQFSSPENPTQRGEWGLVCTDPLPADAEFLTMSERQVRLEPPNDTATNASAKVAAHGAPKRQRNTQLMMARNEHAQTVRAFETRNEAADALGPAAVGLLLSKAAKKSAYPHCFYTLQAHRVFDSYDARETFARCLEDVAWEVSRLREEEEASEAASTGGALTTRARLFEHLSSHLRFAIKELPGYAQALRFVVVESDVYVIFQRVNESTVLRPAPFLLSLVGADSGSVDAPTTKQRGGSSTAAASPATLRHAEPPAVHAKAAEKRGNNARNFEKKREAAPAALKMNASRKKTGMCGECQRDKVEVFPANDPARDPGFYCASCWSRY